MSNKCPGKEDLGLKKIYDSRAEIQNYFGTIIQDANDIVKCMFVSGNFISAVDLERIISLNKNLQFRFLLLNPQSKFLDERNKDLKTHGQYEIKISEWATVISTLQKFKYVKLRFYDFYPFWHLVIIDNCKVYVSYNPSYTLGYTGIPLFLFEDNGEKTSMASAFNEYFDIVFRGGLRLKKRDSNSKE